MKFSFGSAIVAAGATGFTAWLLLTGMVRSAMMMKQEGNASWLVGVPTILFFACVLWLLPAIEAAVSAKLLRDARGTATFFIASALQLGFCVLCYAILARTQARHLTWAVMLAVMDAGLMGVVAGRAPLKKTRVVISPD